ncbi:hypothetical protein HETIRDRAFT_42185 [Heterobasidion irregulare TC 32-1]|uniref:Uncharacterized protein n=1 Tax=Heterobasidion irregulare (strain TC 32-1) TaxID=747525 RepID=W4KLS3_HETIT|nr:uncharacterized protein HETIRDRAFT_42185 [Heterobasidion irregulare TC 32-1]ETW86772.1 hypothetical protein HETIRDRAFT_42185 [Heterobasidion irregulare TC 32-1]
MFHNSIFLLKFHCELDPIEMYWGWCKHWYCKIYKVKFEDAKKVAQQCLNKCPVKVIHQFFNQSWWFMDAYHKGLIGKVAEWAVCKQKSHRRVGQCTMMSVDTMLT